MTTDPPVDRARRQRERRRLRPWAAMVLLCASALVALPDRRGQAAPQVAAALPPQALAQLAAMATEKRARTAAQQKIDSQLLYASRLARGQTVASGVGALDTGVVPEADGRVIADVRAAVTPGLLARMRALGADVLAAQAAYDDVRVQIDLGQLEALAAFSDVYFVAPRQRAITSAWRPATGGAPAPRGEGRRRPLREGVAGRLRAALGPTAAQDPIASVGSRNSQGDRTHLASAARGRYGVTGAGVRIGVLSDSVDGLAQAQASGDLPPVTVLPGKSGVGLANVLGEGTAMLEILHDLAPGAELFFATAFISAADFAQNIRDLRNLYGCHIIVDDVFYLGESPFHDGMTYTSPTNAAVVTQAVKDVTASGALYFSAAGNSGNLNDGTSGTWEGDFVSGGGVGFPSTGEIHEFGPGQTFNVLSATGLAHTLFWSDPLGFGPKNDYDLYRLSGDGTTILAASTNDQLAGADPYEQILSGGAAGHRLVIVKFSGNSAFLHLSTVRGRLSVATHGEISGHAGANAPEAFAVAAAPAISPGPYPGPFSSSSVVETFSSDGPRRIFFHADGTPMTPGNLSSTGGLLLDKPDLTAADGVSVTGSNGLFPATFFGTSAAASHAAAIAALILSRPGPALPAAQVRTAMIGTAIDIEAPGPDRDSGAGIVMAEAAIAAVAHDFNPPGGNVLVNGDFASVITTGTAPSGWMQFATPDSSYIVSDVTTGVFRFYRAAPPPGTTNQAVIFQNTGVAYGPDFPLRAEFDLGNSDTVRKRISVLILDGDFSDLSVCTFWLPPNSPLTTYRMRAHTNKAWSNAAIYFYAASVGSNGGYYLLDNVLLQQNAGGPTTETECVDPLAPAATADPPGAELLVNGDFDTGSLAPWITFGTISSQIDTPHASVGGTSVFAFIRPSATPPAGVVLQPTGQAMAANQIVTATFQLGNSSRALKRVTVILHDNDFSDLSACSFYLLPGQTLSTYVMKAYATEPWTNATLSVYGATIGPDRWMRLDNVSLRRTPATPTPGTDCEEPAVTTLVHAAGAVRMDALAPLGAPTNRRGVAPIRASATHAEIDAAASVPSVLRLNAPIDLTSRAAARLILRLQLAPVPAEGEVQVSTDRMRWVTVAAIAGSDRVEVMDIDLAAFAGRLLWLRIVGRLGDTARPVPGGIWRIERLDIR
jgi:hypothetical protein